MFIPLILTHADCIDGYGAAFCAWLKYRDAAEYCEVSHGSIPDIDSLARLPCVRGRTVYIMDFSFTPEVHAEIVRRAQKVVWLDHHATSFNTHVEPRFLKEGGHRYSCCSALHFTVLDNKKSGARLAWEHFFPNAPLPRLLAYIDDFDRNILQLPGSRSINLALRRVPWSFKVWDRWLHDFGLHGEAPTKAFLAAMKNGRRLQRRVDAQAHEIAKNAIPVFVPGFDKPGLAVACPMLLANDVGALLVRGSGTFALCWLIMPDGTVKASLRSGPDCDVEKLANHHDGGGHRDSAAFRTTIDVLNNWLQPAGPTTGSCLPS